MAEIVLSPEKRAEVENQIREIRKRRLMLRFTGQNGLLEFVKYFWHVLEPQTPFVDGWPLRAICDHLQAVTDGEIKRLLINVPPGFMKSLLVDVFWPAWEWAIVGPHIRYVTFSYSSMLTRRDNRRFGALVSCPEYQELFGDKIQLVKTGEELVSNTKTGWKLASSIGGVGTGERGNRVILDDPHNVKEAESEGVRNETVRWFRESMSNRLNDMEVDAIIIIMQRVHGDDVSGIILEKGMAYDHLMIPMYYDYDRQTDDNYDPRMTAIGWYDPRYVDFDPHEHNQILAWPERFSADTCHKLQVDVDIWAWASQYQQSPSPRGGGIFRRSWWQLWESPDGNFPVLDYVLASVDSAFTEKERNDPTAMTVWGIFRNKEGKNRVILLWAWRKHIAFSGDISETRPRTGESQMDWIQRTREKWGLVEWIKYTCDRFKVDNLLIEAKASGISAGQELSNRYGRCNFNIELVAVKGSKEARALACQPTFSQGLVFAPARDWSETLIEEMEAFPMHKYDDLTDSATQAIRFMRVNDLLINDDEHEARERDLLYHTGKKETLSFW
jgi:predicted phage terminase large subunit-like protein